MINFENGTSVMYEDGFEPSEETIQAIKELLAVGLEMNKSQEKLRKLIGDSHYSQFFGNWDHLRIRKYKKDTEDY